MMPAERAAELGDAAGADDRELADDLLAVERPRQLRGVVVGGEAVDDEGVGEVALGGDRDAGARHRGGLGEPLVGAGVRPRHARREQGEVEIVPPVERQVVDLLRRDRRRDLRADGLHERRFGGDRDRLREGGAQGHRHLHRGADVEPQPPLPGSGAGGGDVHPVVAHGEHREAETPLPVGDGGLRLVALEMGDRHRWRRPPARRSRRGRSH